MKYSIIIPCYNEVDNLGDLFTRIYPLTEKYDMEFLLVENGSTDDSKLYFERNIEGVCPAIRTVYVKKNQGYGYGIQQGIKVANGDYVGWIHADLQMSPESLMDFFDAVAQEKSNKRLFLKAHRTNRSAYELLFTYGQAAFSTLLFGRKMYDVAAVPCLFSRDFLDCVLIDEMPNDFSIDIYVYWQAAKLKYKIIRPDVKIQNRNKGESTWNRGLSSRFRQSRRIIIDCVKMKQGKKVQ